LSLPTIAELQKTVMSFEGWIELARNTGYLQGLILKHIRDKGIFRLEYSSFGEAVKQELDMSERRAYQLIQHAEIVKRLDQQLDTALTESQTRPLTSVPPEKHKEIIDKAAETGKITAQTIKEAVEEVTVTLTVINPDDDDDDDDQTPFDEATEADDEPDMPIEDQVKEENAKIESVCRKITKPLREIEDLPWLKHQGIKNSAIGHIKAGCKLIRAAKCEVCPKCDGGGCDACKMTGRIPDIVKRQLS
jgi:hypothetical protein